MFFKRLEIFGFKSFAEKTVFNFESGITAIVGPNGCGKSNVFDSIRWVLGEQSMKELRGSAKEDVIFNGTDAAAPLGFAEVNLTFANETRFLNTEYDEVTVTRRIFRSGESEYLLNKTIVRLRDIQELLMGTGIGAEAYSLIQQGKVDSVVSARPEERRMLLDEAAGITKYKAKKKEALSKLKSTDENLLRVNDITIEVKRQISSIERQANKARKYKEEFEKLKSLEIRHARFQIDSFVTQKNKITDELNALKTKETKLTQEFETVSQRLTDEINYLEKFEQKINEVHTEEVKLDGQLDMTNRQIGFNEERIQNLETNKERLEAQKTQLIERCQAQRKKIDELKEEMALLSGTIQYNDQLLIEKKDALQSLEKAIDLARKKIIEHEEKTFTLTSQQVGIRNDLTDSMKEMQGALARKRRLELEYEKVSCEKKEMDEKFGNVEGQISGLSNDMNTLATVQGNHKQKIEGLEYQKQTLEQAIDELEKKKLFYKSQKEFIEKMHTQYEDMPDPVVEGRLITQSAPLQHHTGIIGKVKEVNVVQEDHLHYFKEKFESGVQGVKPPLYEIICEGKFIELDPQQISVKIDEIVQEIEQLNLQKENICSQLNEEAKIFEEIEEEILEKEKTHSVLEAQKTDILANIKKFSEELQLVETELIDVKEIAIAVKKKEDELNYKLDTVTKDISWCQNDIKEKQNWITAKSQEKEQTTVTIAQLETEIKSDRGKLNDQQENHRMFCEALDGDLEEIKKIEDEFFEYTSKRKQFEDEIAQLNEKIKEIAVSKEALSVTLADYNTQKADVGQRINNTRTQMISIETQMDESRQQIHKIELQNQQLNFNEQGIKDRLLQSYKIDLDAPQTPQPTVDDGGVVSVEDPAAVQLPEQPVEPINPEEILQEIEVSRKRCDSFGSVNLVAIEEFEELKARFEFLTKQQSDLLEAKSQLMSTIAKINRSTRQMFMDTFAKVSEEFRIYFRMLFGGGEAQLVMLDPENVLESGIDIIAKPPGKKLQNISLLSGGERSLTAIALIFGVFKVKPSPFCVLDEIDAALDEVNVGRFSYLLKDFAKVAQFLVITHNKKTIASSDVMYGITMPETGISRIVSVKLSDNKSEKTGETVSTAA